MMFNEIALIHKRDCFTREILEKRLHELGFNNLARMELFLWDLEIFLHVQDILKEKVVLKGGAATQFYLPIEYQRTSIDIDMICAASMDEVEKALGLIEEKFSGEGPYFKFRFHKPKTPKTDLSLLTYYLDVPSVCGSNELFGGRSGTQEIKIEFFMLNESLSLNNISSPHIFALDTNKTYQVMPLTALIGDKLTTLAVNTVGIPPERDDEYIKQVYDVDALFVFNWQEADFDEIKSHFIYRSKLEAEQRNIPFKMDVIKEDITNQMNILSNIDMENNDKLKKLINDFQSLYLRKSVARSSGEWAISGSRLNFLLQSLDEADGRNKFEIIETIENRLKFDKLHGEEKGNKIRRFSEGLAQEFGAYSRWPAKILKRKHPSRILWAVISPTNLKEVSMWIDDFIKEKSKE
jgi:hypothetical protein